MNIPRIAAVLIFLAGSGIGWFVYDSEMSGSRPFHLGLDLSGGTHLVYRADISNLSSSDIQPSMEALRDTIERRVNLFGVSEPIVQTEKGGFLSGESEQRLIVELPGVTDTQEAIRLIGETPVLEFRLLKSGSQMGTATTATEVFEPTGLTGRYLERAALEFGAGAGSLSNEPVIALTFNSEGADLFEGITRENVGRVLGIFLDGQPISTPVINEPISGGRAIISGGFTPDEAKELARDLNFGALPVPIELISTQTIGSTLGAEAVSQGLMAALWGVVFVVFFMLIWYRVPGIVAIFSLTLYIVLMLAIFKLVPVTLTAAGIAGFILSIGLAVDANVLIFERTKEELAHGKTTTEAIRDGFARAWLPIRDGNASSLITAVILFWFGTSLVEGFALVFGIGILVSMLTAITVSRTLLLALGVDRRSGVMRFLFGSGIKF